MASAFFILEPFSRWAGFRVGMIKSFPCEERPSAGNDSFRPLYGNSDFVRFVQSLFFDAREANFAWRQEAALNPRLQ
jgi:hypothetical protein